MDQNIEKKKLQKEFIKYSILSAFSLILFLLAWQFATEIFRVFPAYALPSPLSTVKAFFTKIVSTSPDGSILIVHIFASLQVVILGFMLGAVIGIPMGILMAWYKPVDMLIKPIFDFLRPIPPIGWVPIFVLLIGIGLQSKIMVVFISAVIPCTINSYSGIKQTSHVHINVAKTFGATYGQILRTVAIPTAMPMIFTGMRVSLGVAWMTLVAAELVAASKGLGYMLQIARTIGRSDIIIMGMLVISAVGAILIAILDFLERKFVRR